MLLNSGGRFALRWKVKGKSCWTCVEQVKEDHRTFLNLKQQEMTQQVLPSSWSISLKRKSLKVLQASQYMSGQICALWQWHVFLEENVCEWSFYVINPDNPECWLERELYIQIQICLAQGHLRFFFICCSISITLWQSTSYNVRNAE